MFIQALFLVTLWFIISMLAVLLGGSQLRPHSRAWSLTWLTVVLTAGNLATTALFGYSGQILVLSIMAWVSGVLWLRWLQDWHAFGQVAWISMQWVTLVFMVYVFFLTAFSALSAASFLAAMVIFAIEAAAALIALTHAYENLDVLCRVRWPHKVDQIVKVSGYAPKVSIHVPCYDEPPELVAATLRSLAALDYPDYEVLVIDNNTPEEANWRALEQTCQQLGLRFRFLHLDQWPGYKSGAMNFALTQTAPDAELVALVDADYQVLPNFLSETVSAFVDPQVAFLQTPQDYRDFADSAYFEPIYYGYKYFFAVPMPVRNEHNAVILAGTMGVIRKQVLQDIGGWDEWCITEDAEASLRILKRGYKGIYYNRSFGFGLMPLNFEGMKKQYFRWCFGGVQLLRKHWEALMPWARLVDPANRLTPAQRYFYLAGGLHWFTSVFNLAFALVLSLLGLLNLFQIEVSLRPLTSPLLVLPSIFLLLNVWRFVWVLRHALRLPGSLAFKAMYALLSVGGVVTLAALRGLVQAKGVFLRTPKSAGKLQVINAVRTTQWETALGLVCLVIGVGVSLINPGLETLLLSVLLLWQASLYLSALAFSLLSLQQPTE